MKICRLFSFVFFSLPEPSKTWPTLFPASVHLKKSFGDKNLFKDKRSFDNESLDLQPDKSPAFPTSEVNCFVERKNLVKSRPNKATEVSFVVIKTSRRHSSGSRFSLSKTKSV